jgi:two-component system invasion response regulator UvrY
MLRILIADDHAVVRQGVKKILVEELGNIIFGEAQNGAEVLELVEGKKWDILIMDISMPGRSGLDILKDLRREYRDLSILVLSIYPEDHYAIRALRSGASGYITKASAPDELVKAIKKILAGEKYISADLARKLPFYLDRETEQSPHEKLSDREYQVMCMIASGKTPTLIAEELCLSVKSISTYRSRILEKLGLKTNAELIHYALENKLV